MITDENHPEMVRALADLVSALGTLARRRPLVDRETHRQVLQLRDEHATKWRLRGVDFPHLVLFSVPKLGSRALELWREDLELSSIQVKVVNFVKMYPDVASIEIVAALKAAYPWLQLGDLVPRQSLGAVRH